MFHWTNGCNWESDGNIDRLLDNQIFSQPNLTKYLSPFPVSPILDVLGRLCNSCQTL